MCFTVALNRKIWSPYNTLIEAFKSHDIILMILSSRPQKDSVMENDCRGQIEQAQTKAQ